jgi:hypothetical protein
LCKPGERAFRLVDGDLAKPAVVADLSASELKVLRALRIDVAPRRGRLRRTDRCAHCCTGALSLRRRG